MMLSGMDLYWKRHNVCMAHIEVCDKCDPMENSCSVLEGLWRWRNEAYNPDLEVLLINMPRHD